MDHCKDHNTDLNQHNYGRYQINAKNWIHGSIYLELD